MTNVIQPQEKEELQSQEGVERTRPNRVFVPRVDIYTNNDEIVILADMPGIDAETVDVTLEKNVLTIKGFVKPEAPDNYTLAYAEYGEGDYERSFTLTDEVDRDNIKAMVSKGVLHLHLPKATIAKTRKISVKTG